MDNYRFNWGGPPVWETDERKILNVTARLSLELERHNDGRNTYNRNIFNARLLLSAVISKV